MNTNNIHSGKDFARSVMISIAYHMQNAGSTSVNAENAGRS